MAAIAEEGRRIVLSLLDLLGELDSVGFQESDRSVFEEIAHLFDDVAQAARRGAADMRDLAAGEGGDDQGSG